MLCAYSSPFIIYLLSQPLCFQGISDNRKAGKYPASLRNGVDESDRAYADIIVRMFHRHCSPNTKPISASASSIFSMNSGSRARQKLFRFLDNKFDSEKYRNNVRELTPAILAVLPLEYRGHLVEQDSFMARLAEMEKELCEAKQAVILNAPRHQKLKEMSEGIVSMFRVDPDLAGPLMAMVTTMLGAI